MAKKDTEIGLKGPTECRPGRGIAFFAEGIPKPQPRPRAFYREGLGVRAYDPGTAEGWKSCIAVAFKEKFDGRTMLGPVSVVLDFYFPRPNRMNEKKFPSSQWWPHVIRPDCDNLAKSVLDALSRLSAWKDDSQVYCLVVNKSYVVKTNDAELRPGVMVQIKEISGAI